MKYIESLLSEGEEIVHVSRQHWFILVPSVVEATIIALLVVAASAGVYIFVAGAPLLLPIGLLGILIIPVGKTSVDWLRWKSRTLVITNIRVIHVEGIFGKNVLDSSLEKVNDVMMEQSLFGRFFDYGDLEILTASETGANRFERIAHPIECKTAMLDQKLLLEHQTPATTAMDIPTQIAKLAALREKGIISDSEFEGKKTELLKRM